ncbi:SHOCT domain-containing protein [Streptococcus anginosus]|uniref:SHOCT domain-containing protein n=1 Tax=Streptococcus anginosus TaxID=1328 RepID=UPI0021F8CAE3|nr:SHOCT domain-containing protein [Streptococcus anginosus]MCW0950295.1 SHOCT domain-containing protein [Streptococcus anginosus]MCW0963805.1 SHOCT domain-containing protein [Streptococcus anginosus]
MGIFDSAEMKEAKRQYKEEMKQLAEAMQPTGKIFMCAKWDDNLRVISLGSMGLGTIVKYDTIKDIQIFESVKEVTSTKSKGKEKRKGVMTRAAVGTILMPGVGTLAGALTAKKQSTGESEAVTNQQVTRTIVLTRDDPFKTVLNIPYNAELEVKLRSILAENLSQVAPVEQVAEVSQVEQPVSSVSVADELMKLKELLDAGVLTEEEFTAQKQRLLQ